MTVRIEWKELNGTLVKGFSQCTSSPPRQYNIENDDVNLGVTSASEASRTRILKGSPYILDVTFGVIAPSNDLTDVKLFLSLYPSGQSVTLQAAEGTYCDDLITKSLEDYVGSQTAQNDIDYLLTLGDEGIGVQYSLDRGKTFSSFSTTNGNPADENTYIVVPTTAMSIGRTDGVLQPEDNIEMHVRVVMPTTISDTDVGLKQFMVGTRYGFTS